MGGRDVSPGAVTRPGSQATGPAVTSGAVVSRGAADSGAVAVVVVAVAVLVAVGAVLAARRGLRSALALRATWPADQDGLALPPARVIHLASLGHDEAAADLVAARANVAFGGRLGSPGESGALARALGTAVDLDPGFHGLYLRGAAMIAYGGGAFTVEALEASNQLLERGSRAFPDDWELQFQRGFNLLFELPKLVATGDPRLPAWRRAGLDALRGAGRLDGAPVWLPSLAARMSVAARAGAGAGAGAGAAAIRPDPPAQGHPERSHEPHGSTP